MPKDDDDKTRLFELMDKSPFFGMLSYEVQNFIKNFYQNAKDKDIKKAVTSLERSNKKAEQMSEKYTLDQESSEEITILEAEAKTLVNKAKQVSLSIKSDYAHSNDLEKSEEVLDQLDSIS